MLLSINILQYTLLLFNLFNLSTCKEVQAPKPKTIEQSVDSVLVLMTTQEKIGQLTQFTSDWDVTGPTMRAEYKEDIRKGRVGSIFNAHTAKYNYELQRIAVEETRMKIPLIFGYDVIHGYKTIFPIPLGEAGSWDLKAIEQSASVAAAEAAAAGLHWTFAPMVDISRDARWGRVMEGAGEDTYLGAEVAKARVRGFQGSSFERADKVVACVKHFAAYGAPLAGREYNTVDMSDRMFREIYLPPYAAAVKEGCMTVMTSFNEFDGVPCTGNSYLLRDVLRKELGFKGFVVTDYTAINEMVKHGIVADEKAAGELALNAGVDMDMQGVVFFNYMEKSVKEGKVKMADLDQAVRNILAVKFKLGLFDHPYKYMDSKREATEILSAKNQSIALEVAKKSIVLLKNEKNTLPLSATAKIALIGPLTDNKSELIGAWSAAGNFKDCVSLEEGLRKAAPNARIEKAKGCDFESSDRSGFAEAVQVASKADVIIAAIGETAAMSGEAASRTSISIPGVQEELIKELLKTGKPVVIVLMNGRPLAIPYLADNCTAILETWFLGTQAGNAIAEVIFGKYNPSGKLTMSFPRNLGQVPLFYNNKNTGRPMPEDANFKYYSKYIDVVNTPQYPFGFGLSYTQFEYSGLKVSKKKFKKGESVVVSVDISNTGKYDGEETAQMYIHDLVASVTRPVRELKGFQKLFLKSGEKKTISFTIGEKELMLYTRDNKYTSEAGEFDIFIGTDSNAEQSTRVTMD
ncbi:MAG: glycoside hydrolase family 3 N-terminal domain-containing protein [Saprospiraceae bacterium]